jgi:hypothetical protein
MSLANKATKGRSKTWMDTATKERVGMRRGTW